MKTSAQIEEQLRSRADEDAAFRTRLVDDPRGAIEEATGLKVPEGFSVHVHEESATDLHLVLPPAGGEISGVEMREAAGGSPLGDPQW